MSKRRHLFGQLRRKPLPIFIEQATVKTTVYNTSQIRSWTSAISCADIRPLWDYMHKISLVPVKTRKQKDAFFSLPYRLHSKLSTCVLPLRLQTRDLLDSRKHPFFLHADMKMFLAEQAGKTVGRVAVFRDDHHNESYQENVVHFGFFESEDDPEIAKRLFEAANDYATSQGASQIRGPFNHSVHEETGLQITGFDEKNYIMIPGNPPYYPALLEAAGLQKCVDLHCYRLELRGFSDKVVRLAKRVEERLGVRVRAVTKATLKNDIDAITDIYNQEWSKHWPWTRIPQKEMDLLVKNLLLILDLRGALIIEDSEDNIVGFSLAVPNINQILAENRSGRLLSLSTLKLLWRLNRGRLDEYRVLVMGVRKKWQNKGVDMVLHYHLQARGMQHGIKTVELSQVLETNVAMMSVANQVGAHIAMTHRIYEMPVVLR